MPKRRARSPTRLVDVVFLAGTASGTVFSLSNFQMLSGGSVPLNCILAYNTPIRGCRIRDFTEKTCSEECRDSLNEVQNNVQASCDLISASEGTLLSKAQKGTLTDSLCRPEDVSTSIAPTPTPETTIRSFSIIPSETPPPPESTSESSTISSIPSTSEPESTPLSTSTSKIKSTVKPKSTSTPPLSSTTSESALAKSTSTTTTQRPKQTIPPGSGGGSPFDFVGASSKLRPLDAVLLLSAAGCAAALLVA